MPSVSDLTSKPFINQDLKITELSDRTLSFQGYSFFYYLNPSVLEYRSTCTNVVTVQFIHQISSFLY